MNSHRCPNCGAKLGGMQVHTFEDCERQQEVNRTNLGVRCRWCGSQTEKHRYGCPMGGKPT